MANELIHKSVGAVLTQAEFEGIDQHVLNSQVTGDMVMATSATSLQRLGIGNTNDLLTVVAGLPAWVATGGGSPHAIDGHNDTAVIVEARGMIFYRTATQWDGLAIGGSGTFLSSDGTDPSWAAIAIDDLSDVAITSVATGEILGHNGSTFLNRTLVEAGIAPNDSQYVVLAANGDLTVERVLTGTANQITITDNGAGGTVVLATPQDIHTGASPTFAGMSLTAILNGTVGGNAFSIQNTTDGVSNQVGILSGGNRATALDNDEAFLTLRLDDNLGALTEFVRLTWKALDVTNDSKDSRPEFQYYTANTLRELSFPPITADDVVAVTTLAQTLVNKTLTLPAIGDFTNANHDHTDSAGGGVISGSGDVTGPGSSVDNEIVRFDSTTGKIIQAYTSGGPTISDTGLIAFTKILTGTVAGNVLSFQNTTDAVSNQVGILSGGNRGTPANNDEAYLTLRLDDNLGAQTEFVRLTWKALDVTNDSKDSRPEFQYYTANALRELSFPPITSDDVVAVVTLAQTLTNKTFNDFTNTIDADRLHVEVRNESGGILTKGTPVYISGYSIGQEIVLVDKADANGSGTMPALGLIEDELANNATGSLIKEGIISGVDTSGFSVGDILYVSETAGVLTVTRPTAAGSLVQSMGEVLRSHATLGVIDIESAGRVNDIPNSISPAQLILPNSAAPTPTTEADIQWETDRDLIVVGDGSSQKFFLPVVDATSDPLDVNTSAADGTEDTTARKDHVHNVAEGAVTQHEGAIDHDALTNFVALEHLPVTDATSDPLIDGDAAADGTEATVARKDHVHPKHHVKYLDSDAVSAVHSKEAAIEFIIDGGGSAITTGVKGYLEIPFACTITAVRLLADQSGSVVVDIWKDTYANYPPTVADTITASAVPEIAASGIKDEDETLTGWTVALSKGDILYYNVDTVATIEWCLITLMVDKT